MGGLCQTAQGVEEHRQWRRTLRGCRMASRRWARCGAGGLGSVQWAGVAIALKETPHPCGEHGSGRCCATTSGPEADACTMAIAVRAEVDGLGAVCLAPARPACNGRSCRRVGPPKKHILR